MINTSMETNQQVKVIQHQSLNIVYEHYLSAEQTVNEIFNELPYSFTTNNSKPFIIDAGSNIGIATLFFKSIYPDAKLLCFEPDPHAFALLNENIAINHVTNVQLINAALAKQQGEIDFFGQFYMDCPDARGNSIIDTWGLQRVLNNITKVQSVMLSSFIHETVDYLKLDIEGAEQQVLEDLEQQNKLQMINQIAIEVHQADKIKHVNDIDTILDILDRNHFTVKSYEKNIEGMLPEQVAEWAKNVNPKLFIVHAHR